MTDSAPQFETQDDLGSTLQYSGHVGMTPILIPTVSGYQLSEVMVVHPNSVSGVENQLILFVDNIPIDCGGYFSWHYKGDKRQVSIHGNSVSGVAYSIILNTDE